MAVSRQVKTLRLRSTRESALRKGAILLEDALRTASFPAAEGSRLLIVRRLSLGRIRAGASSMSAAVAIEECFRRLSASAVHVDDPGAEDAPAVFFRDELEPYIVLARRMALGQNTGAWFWRSALPAWQPTASTSEDLRWLLHRLIETPFGSAAVERLTRTLLLANRLGILLAALKPEDGPVLLQAFGWQPPPLSAEFTAEDTPRFADVAGQDLLKNFMFVWTSGDTRTRWLALLLLTMAKTSLRHSALIQRMAASLIRQMEAGPESREPFREEQSRSPLGSDEAPKLAALSVPGINAEPHQASGIEERNSSASPGPHQQFISFEGPRGEMQETAPGTGRVFPVPLGQHSYRAGLFFLLPVMERIGLPQWIDELRETVAPNFPEQVLRAIAFRLETASQDAALLALAENEAGHPTKHEDIRAWIARLRVYCRRRAGIGLHSLVCRYGQIASTPTHLDVYLLARDANIRVRRAGLDLNPGWLPWFGKVVNFHYLSQGELHG